MPIPGVPPAELPDLTRAEDRISFVYLERSVIHRDSNALTATDDRGVVHIPAASVGVVLLGPGTSITHQAIALLAASASAVLSAWPGDGQGAYCHQTRQFENCGYPTLEACLLTRSGVGGICVPNPKYVAAPERRPRNR